MRSKHINWCRNPRSTYERRANSDPEVQEYVRGKRMPMNLPDTWDDKPTTTTKCWKDKRKTQYYPDGRGKKYEIVLKDEKRWGPIWRLEEYFREHDIPYRIENIEKNYRFKRVIRTKRVLDHTIPYYYWKYEYVDGKFIYTRQHQIGYREIFKEIPLDKPIVRWYNGTRLVGHRVIWWYDKDIGIDRIIQSCNWI